MSSNLITNKNPLHPIELERVQLRSQLQSVKFKISKARRSLTKLNKRLKELRSKLKQNENASWKNTIEWIKMKKTFYYDEIEDIINNLSSHVEDCDDDEETEQVVIIRKQIDKLWSLKFGIDDLIVVRHTSEEKDESLVMSIYKLLLKNNFHANAKRLISKFSKVNEILSEMKIKERERAELQNKWVARKADFMKLKHRLKQYQINNHHEKN